jgi:cell division protein FtsI (penicillin-binding protein 3)
VLVVALALATVKLVVVQGPQAGTLQAGSARQRTTEVTLPAERGSILDRAGAPLAFSVEARALVTNPRLIATLKGAGTAAYVSEMAAAVAQATGTDANVLRGMLSSDKGYVVLVPLVDPDVARALRDRFPEIAEEQRDSRQ